MVKLASPYYMIKIDMRLLFPAIALLLSANVFAAESSIKVPLNIVNEKGIVAPAGDITISETPYGLVFTPALKGLPAGVHGFHIHANASCDPEQKDGKSIAAGAAGGHWDPEKTGQHEGPYGNGHKGDLPALYVTDDGQATYPVLAPRLHSLSDIRGHALMFHAGGDNHSDHPAALGGGGARFACGVIPQA
jgi:Cu-Zn family superoxide dismutase